MGLLGADKRFYHEPGQWKVVDHLHPRERLITCLDGMAEFEEMDELNGHLLGEEAGRICRQYPEELAEILTKKLRPRKDVFRRLSTYCPGTVYTNPAMIQALIECLTDTDKKDVCYSAAIRLKVHCGEANLKVESRETLMKLLASLHSDQWDFDCGEQKIRVLLANKKFVREHKSDLLENLTDPDGLGREWDLRLLTQAGIIGDTEYVNASTDSSPALRVEALRSLQLPGVQTMLANYGDRNGAEVLIRRGLQDPTPEVCIAALDCVTEFKALKFLPDLLTAFKRDNHAVKSSVINAFERLNTLTPEVSECLQSAAMDPAGQHTSAAVNALVSLTASLQKDLTLKGMVKSVTDVQGATGSWKTVDMDKALPIVQIGLNNEGLKDTSFWFVNDDRTRVAANAQVSLTTSPQKDLTFQGMVKSVTDVLGATGSWKTVGIDKALPIIEFCLNNEDLKDTSFWIVNDDRMMRDNRVVALLRDSSIKLPATSLSKIEECLWSSDQQIAAAARDILGKKEPERLKTLDKEREDMVYAVQHPVRAFFKGLLRR